MDMNPKGSVCITLIYNKYIKKCVYGNDEVDKDTQCILLCRAVLIRKVSIMNEAFPLSADLLCFDDYFCFQVSVFLSSLQTRCRFIRASQPRCVQQSGSTSLFFQMEPMHSWPLLQKTRLRALLKRFAIDLKVCVFTASL